MTAMNTPANFQALLASVRNNCPKPPTKSIDAATFLTRNRRATHEQQRQLIKAYTGNYDVGMPHGVQLDNACSKARLELSPITEIVYQPIRSLQSDTSSMIRTLITRGRDLENRIENAKDYNYTTAELEMMKADLEVVKGTLEQYAK